MTDWTVIEGDSRVELAKLPEKSCHVCVTSPPYWSLRAYEGVEPSVWGGDKAYTCHRHDWENPSQWNPCQACGAWYGLLGLEPQVDLYVEHIVECFRAVRRVLRDDGCLFLNCGDSYSHTKSGPIGDKSTVKDAGRSQVHFRKGQQGLAPGFASKQLIGQPWKIAFALQADGWYLRSDIIWHKPNPLPESVTDRPTKAHEYVFLFAKQPKYFYDAEAVREKAKYGRREHSGRWISGQENRDGHRSGGGSVTGASPETGRNKRSVWTIPTEANPEAHFASFPRKLVVPCILAGTSEKGCCPECGAPWIRVLERDRKSTRPARDNKQDATGLAHRDHGRHVTNVKTLGWKPGCGCRGSCSCIDDEQGHDDDCYYNEVLPPVPCTVLDPYLGSGTTLIVAKQLGRRGIGIEASPKYCEMARRRIKNPKPEPEIPDVEGQLTFGDMDDGQNSDAYNERVTRTASAGG